MNVIKEMLSNIETTPLQIGRVGENLHTQVRINCITIFQDYPEALVDMSVVPPVGDAYPAIVERDGVVVVWDVLSSDLAYEGRGQIQLTFRDDEEIIKTVIGSTTILPSIEPTGEAPTPIENWIDEANEILDEFGEVTNMTASAETVAAGASAEATVSKVDGHFNINFKIPRGASGNETIDDTAGIGDTDKVWSADKDAKEISALKSAKAPIIIEAISTPADIMAFPDGADGMLVKTLTVGITPVQDLHGQDSPYPAGGGKNLFFHEGNLTATNNGITATFDSDSQSITISGTNTSTSAYVLLSIACTGDIPRETPLARALINVPSGVYANFTYRKNMTWVAVNNGGVVPEDTDEGQPINIQIGIYGTATTIPQTVMYVELEKGSTAPTSYSPYSNICPITGHTGANVSRTGKNLFGGVFDTKYDLFIPANNTFTVSAKKLASGNLYFAVYNKSGVVINYWYINNESGDRSYRTFTLSYDIYGVRIYYTQATDIQLELGSETTYEPYQGSTYPITFPSSAGTVYGGSLTIHQDGSGELVVDRANVDAGTLTWANNVTGIFSNQLVGMSTANAQKVICSIYGYGVTQFGWDKVDSYADKTINTASNDYIYIKDTSYSDAASFKSAMSGEQLVYELATPVTYQLTNQQVIETLKGVNNIWADTGKINAVDYSADTKLYIDKKLTELQALVLEN